MDINELFNSLERIEQIRARLEREEKELLTWARENLATKQKGHLSKDWAGRQTFQVDRISADYVGPIRLKRYNQDNTTRAHIVFSYTGPVLKKDGTPHARNRESSYERIYFSHSEQQQQPETGTEAES